MTPLVVNSRVGKDGVLHLDVPMDIGDADREVRITVEPLAPANAISGDEWRAWVASMAGSWQGSFERMPQDNYELRAPLS